MPRNGQWMKFHVAPALAVKMREAGCFETADGYFLSIWDAGKAPKDNEPGRPARLMPCNRQGNNVVVIQDGEPRNLGFDPIEVTDLIPMTKKEDYPPEYVGNTSVDPRP